jgi:hypothetical protein
MAFGGFFGNEPILPIGAFAEKVKRGEVRYVLLGARSRAASEFAQWVRANGKPVDVSEWRSYVDGGRRAIQLYDVKPD